MQEEERPFGRFLLFFIYQSNQSLILNQIFMKNKFLHKQRGILVALFSFLCVISIKAQTWTAPNPEGTAFAAGTGYYVYNVGGKSFLDRGADWSTMAALGSGALITPVQSTTLWILQYDSSTRTLFPGGTTDGSVYTDNVTSNTWDVQLTDAINNVYSIQVNSTYGGYNASQYLGASATVFNSNRGLAYDVRYNRAASEYTQWKFCTAAAYAKYNAQVQLDKYMKIAQLVGSSVDLNPYVTTYNTGTAAEINTAATNLSVALAPTDKTTSITNPNFDTNITGWTATTGSGYNFTEVEYWQKNFDFNQTLTGLPAGVYVVKVQGYERPINLNTADHTGYTNGWDALNSRFYATASGIKTFQPLKNLFAETTCTVGTAIDGLIFPNNMSDAQAAFTAGLYDNELGYVTVDATGSLTIGISSTYDNNRAGRWNVFDNFRLYYYGALAIPNISLSKSSLFISDAIATTETFNVTGANLTSDVTITAPAGITLTGTNLVNNGGGTYTIALTNANATSTITATWDDSANMTGNITVASTSVTTQNISVATSKDNGCFTPLQPSGNKITEPYLNSLTTFGGWGAKSINTDPAYVFCGASSGKITGAKAGSIDVDLKGKVRANASYRVKAMIYSVGGKSQIGVANMGVATIEMPTATTDTWEVMDFTFSTGATLGTLPLMYFNNYLATGGSTISYIDNWEMYQIPSVTVTESSVAAMAANVGSTDSKTITVSGKGLSGAITLALSGANADQFSVSTTSLPLAADSVASTVVTITYTPTFATLSHAATLTISSAGATDKVFSLSASAGYTSAGTTTAADWSAYATDNVLKVNGVNSFVVYSVQGLKVAQVVNNVTAGTITLNQGIYFVKSDKGVQKVIVK